MLDQAQPPALRRGSGSDETFSIDRSPDSAGTLRVAGSLDIDTAQALRRHE